VLRGAWSFHWAKSGENATQVTAIGPLGLELLDPANDPRKQGRLPTGPQPTPTQDE
jgi:hypothetical protein